MSNIKITPAAPSDARELLEIYAPYVLNTAISFEYDVPSEQEFAARIEKTLQFYPYILAKDGDEIIGYAYTSRFHPRAAYDWNAETSVYLKQTCKGRGVGKLLCTALEEISRRQNIIALDACIAVPHSHPDAHLDFNSRDFHAHIGYKELGRFPQCGYKFGTWYDMVWMEKTLSERPEKPTAVVSAKI
ncbi:MAG: GNAT family N-acetyltransferase [Clostridia bacterium]|nr:GNAT family N-acetyltransferase [Clostridia bacterium]